MGSVPEWGQSPHPNIFRKEKGASVLGKRLWFGVRGWVVGSDDDFHDDITPRAIAFGADGLDADGVGFGALQVRDGGAAAGGDGGLLPG